MSDWKEYTGTDKQISEMLNAENGFIGNSEFSITKDPFVARGFFDAEWLKKHLETYKVTHYWIIPSDPLREMKIRHAKTGQPVWVRLHDDYGGLKHCTTSPNWSLPKAKYSFTPFED